MNASSTREHQSMALVEIIQFKWLMSHEGQHVHVERMQADPGYAAEQLSWAAASSNSTLATTAQSLRGRLLPTA
jgi:hypothetical protein